MTDDEFIAVVLASPEDRSTRLVYADWLDERGDARGELVRIVDEMWQTPICTSRYRKLRFRRDNLAKKCDAGWLKMMLRPAFSEMRRMIGELDRLDPGRSVFASGTHKYRLNPPLPVAHVGEFEKRVGCRLPEQYRRFVTEFADGGAGPDYGVRPLEPLLDKPVTDWLATLGQPFPVPSTAADMDALYDSSPGVLPICEIGCGGFHNLIVAGPEAGNVWVESADGGSSPELLDESHLPRRPDVSHEAVLRAAIQSPQALKLEFIDWYVHWLDGALWKISCASTPEDEVFDLDPETTTVYVSSRNLTTVSEKLRTVTALTRLSLHGNSLTQLPDWIGSFANLEYLGVGYNPLASLPESIGSLSQLEELTCGGTKVLEELPDSIGRLTRLRSLHLSFNLLKSVPASIGNLSQLRDLDLAHNQLTALPDTIGRLAQLRELKLTWNKVTGLPDSFARLHELRELDLRSNLFQILPNCVADLPALERLGLGENPNLDIADACRKLAHVPTLRSLSFHMNKLTELPAEIGLLTQLTRLDLGWNNLVRLPAALASLTTLEHLNLDHNKNLISLRQEQQQLLPHLH